MPPTTSQKEPNSKWDAADDAKLRELIAQGIDPTDLSLRNIKLLHSKWPHRKYKTFAAHIRNKLKTISQGRIIDGARGECQLIVPIVPLWSARCTALTSTHLFSHIFTALQRKQQEESDEELGSDDTDSDEEQEREDTDGEKSVTDNEEEEMPPKTTTPKKASAGSTPKKAMPKKSADDVVDLMGALRIASDDWGDLHHFMKGKDEAKTSEYLKMTILDGQEIQHWEIRVDIFPGAPVKSEEIKLTLSDDGMWLMYRRDKPAWIGSNKHFRSEFLSDTHGAYWDPNNSENMGLFKVAQEIRAKFPSMDDAHQLIGSDDNIQLIKLPRKCKGVPYDVKIRPVPTGNFIDYQGHPVPTFFFKIDCHLMGATEILQRKARAIVNATVIHGLDDLYD